MCKNSTRRFYCENHHTPDFSPNNFQNDPLFVPLRKMFDGNEDCVDGSDECPLEWIKGNPFSSRYKMIKVRYMTKSILFFNKNTVNVIMLNSNSFQVDNECCLRTAW